MRQSLTGRRWSLTPIDERLAAALAQRHGLPEIVARVLAARGVGLSEVESFLAPKLRDLLPDPCRLKDMRAGAERLAAAITGGERIAVFGDYDVDGATAAALLLRFLSAAGSAGSPLRSGSSARGLRAECPGPAATAARRRIARRDRRLRDRRA